MLPPNPSLELAEKIEAKILRLVEKHIDEGPQKAHQAGIRGRSFDEFKKELLKAKTPASPSLAHSRQQQPEMER